MSTVSQLLALAEYDRRNTSAHNPAEGFVSGLLQKAQEESEKNMKLELMQEAASQREKAAEEQREYMLRIKLAEAGVDPDKSKLESTNTGFSRLTRVFKDADSVQERRGVKVPAAPAMSLVSGGVGDAEGIPIQEEAVTFEGGAAIPPSNMSRLAAAKREQIEAKRDPASLSGLPPAEQVKARSLARRLYGVRGAEKGLPAIISYMREGKTIDQIEDEIRFSGQSSELMGPMRDAAQEILITSNGAMSEKALDYIDDEFSRGNIDGAKSKLKRLARQTAGVELSRNVQGKERTLQFLTEIQNDLNELERNGINTNIFSGTVENMAKMVGTVKNPSMRKTATKIQTAIQNYRRSMSGVAFSVPESKEYADMFPGVGRVANFNTANIDALKDVMSGDLDSFYGLTMGEENYRKLFLDNGVPSGESVLNSGFSYLWE